MTTANVEKKFTREVDGATIHYRRTEKGYCYMGTARIKASEFEQAEIEAMRERQERNEAVAARLRKSVKECEREEDAVNRGSSNIVKIDGHEYAYSHVEGKCWCDGEEITRAEFDRALGKKSRSKSKGRSRKPKDVGFELDGTVLTTKQADFLRELSAAGQDGVLGNAKSGWWCDCITDGIGGQFAGKPMTVGAMISTLCEKGLAERSKEKRDNRTATTFSLTEDGQKVWKSMKLK